MLMTLEAVLFQSTPPMREATSGIKRAIGVTTISIHASHAGGDKNVSRKILSITDFNPRLPCGRRPAPNSFLRRFIKFQSTPPMREATYLGLTGDGYTIISIHASHAGGDRVVFKPWLRLKISIHASHAGGDWHYTYSRNLF